MRLSPLTPLSLALALAGAAAPLAGQSLPEVLAHVPPQAQSVIVLRDWSKTMAGAKAALTRLKSAPQGMDEMVKGLGLTPALLAPGPMVEAAFPVEPKGEKTVTWVPVKDFDATARALKGVRSGAGYLVKGGSLTYTMVKHGNFACFAQDAALAKSLDKPETSLAADLAPLDAWFGAHDMVFFAPGASTRKGLAEMKASMETTAAKDPNQKALQTVIAPLVSDLVASVQFAGCTMDFPADGHVTFTAKAFFRPGSPLAKSGAAFSGHAMEGLHATGFILGLGGPWPSSLAGIFDALASTLNQGDPNAAKRSELQTRNMKNLRSWAFTFGQPASAADPLMGNTRFLMTVEDLPQYFADTAAMAELPQPQLEMLGLKSSIQKDILPGTPSFTQTFTVTPSASSPLPVGSVKMVLAMVFGTPDRIMMSYAKVDEHRALAVFGDAQALKAALADPAPSFEKDPRVVVTDAMLPADAPWRFYVDLASARDLAQNLMASFAPQAKPLPVLPPNPPLGAALSVDAQGITFTAAASSQSLDALGFLSDSFPKSEKKPKVAGSAGGQRPKPKAHK